MTAAIFFNFIFVLISKERRKHHERNLLNFSSPKYFNLIILNSPNKTLVACTEASFRDSFTQRLISALFAMLNASRSKCEVATEECPQNCPSKHRHGICANELTNKCHA
jgi:hypothetical protein